MTVVHSDVIAVDELADVAGLTAGITTRASDFGLSTGGSFWAVADRYEALARRLGFTGVAVCRQVHGTSLVSAGEAPSSGLWIPGKADGFVGSATGRLFAVTVADCVPVYVVDPRSRAFALLHAGWRGAAAKILSQAVQALSEGHGVVPSELRVHLGAAICGDCYEVGPEVPAAFGHRVEGKSMIDIRSELAREAQEVGVAESRVSVSSFCTRCDVDRLHSYRGDAESSGRMAAYVGWEA